MNRIYVTGHRNPDTDSIAAAISYAALRNALGDRDYVAAHLGHISDETKRLLDRFGFQEPVTISNVRTQVRDLDFDTPPALNSSVTMDRAWHIMRDQNISAVPIINEDGTLYGMLSAGDIAAYSMRTISDRHVDALPLFNLLSVIEGRILNDGAEQVDRVSGVVTIALPQSCDNLLFSDPDSIILCGNQPDMIRRALDIGVQCIILCQTDVDPAWLENAGKTCVISTPLDASRVARLVYQAIPISRPCNTEDLVSFHLDDYIDDVREVVLESRYRCYPVLDENEKVVGTLSRYHLLRPRRKRVVLVDHNELAQAVPGLEQAEILEIIDHHRLADIQTTQPIRVRNEPVGSTTTIITNMYQEHGVMPSPNMAGLMAGADLVRHGHVQVPHVHEARHRHGRASGPHRQRLAQGAGQPALCRLERGRQVGRRAVLRRLQGVPHRRPLSRRRSGHVARLRRGARAQGRAAGRHGHEARAAAL